MQRSKEKTNKKIQQLSFAIGSRLRLAGRCWAAGGAGISRATIFKASLNVEQHVGLTSHDFSARGGGDNMVVAPKPLAGLPRGGSSRDQRKEGRKAQ